MALHIKNDQIFLKISIFRCSTFVTPSAQNDKFFFTSLKTLKSIKRHTCASNLDQNPINFEPKCETLECLICVYKIFYR